MRILLIIFVISTLCLISMAPAFADDDPKQELATIYGEELMKVPPLIRLQFQNTTGKSWVESTFEERESFLLDWQENRKADQKALLDRAKDFKDKQKIQEEHALARQAKKLAKARAAQAKEEAKQKEKETRDKKTALLKQEREDAMRKLKEIQQSRNKK